MTFFKADNRNSQADEECIDEAIFESIRKEIKAGLPMKYYFEHQFSASAAFAPVDETEKIAKLMGNDVKRYPINNPAPGTNNGQLAARFATRSLWLEPSSDGGIVPVRINRALCK